MSQNDGVFFEVVPESYEEETVSGTSLTLDGFCEQALSEGFTQDVVEEAKKHGKDCTSYAEFADIINRVLNNLDDADRKEAQRKLDVQRSIQRQLQKLANSDIMGLLDQKIQQVYNTTAVASLELTEVLAKTFTVEMQQLYGNVAYAAYICMKSAWVKQGMKVCLDKWDESMDTKNFISAYLKTKGASDETMNANIRKLPEYLPDAYKNESSPVLYKAYVSMQLMTHKNTDSDIDVRQVLSCVTYYKTLKKYFDRGTPYKAACAIATYAACKELGIKASYGYTVIMPYTGWCLFDAALNNALGPMVEEFNAPPKKEENNTVEEKLERDIKKQAAEKPKVHVATNTQPVKPVVRKTPKKKQSVNIAPYIPKWFMAAFIHVVICIILLLFTRFFAALAGIAFVFATIGWFNVENNTDINGKSPYLYIVGGYMGFIATMLLYLM